MWVWACDGSDGKASACQCRKFNPWAGKIPWRKKWQVTLEFLPGEFHGQRSPVGYSAWGCKELDMTEWLTLSLSHVGGRWVRGGAGFGCTVFRFWVLRCHHCYIVSYIVPDLLFWPPWGGVGHAVGSGQWVAGWSEVHPGLSRALSGPRWPITLKIVVLHQLGPGARRQKHRPLVRKIPWRRKWQPTPVFLPREFHGHKSLVGHRVTKSQTQLKRLSTHSPTAPCRPMMGD